MKSKVWLIAIIYFLISVCAAAQTGQTATDYTAKRIQFMLLNPPQPVPSASVFVSGNPGPATYYYWIITQTSQGASSPAGPFPAVNSPNTLSGSNFNQVNWTTVSGGNSYDVLRTSNTGPPFGACNCAVATGVTGNQVTDQSNALNAYTVNTLDPNTLTVNAENIGGVLVFDHAISAAGISLTPGPITATTINGFQMADQLGNKLTNGIATGISNCGAVNPCTVIVPPDYPITEAVPGSIPPFLTGGGGAATSANVQINDFRFGDYETAVDPLGQSPNPNYRAWHSWTADYFRPLSSTFMNLVDLNLNITALDGGQNINQNSFADKTNISPLDVRLFGYTPGQKVGVQAWVTNYSTGDTLPLYGVATCYGGFTAGGDESCKAIDAEAYQGNAEYVGTISVTQTGTTSLTVTPTAASGTQAANRVLYDASTGTLSAGTITAITFTNANTPVNITGSATTFGTSTVNTTSNTAVTAPGTFVITPVSLTGISNGSVLCIADPKEFEHVVASSVGGGTFTATFRYPHPTGFIIAAGGGCGKYIALTADNVTTAVFGTSSSPTFSGNAPPNGTVFNTLHYLIPVIRSTSNTSADIWLSSPNLGYISYRGRWTSGGTNTYTMFQGAEVTSVQQSGVLSNTLTLEPNSATWTSGDTVAEAEHYSINVNVGTLLANKYFPSSQGAQPGVIDVELYGLWDSFDNIQTFSNNTPASIYTTGGGVLSPPNLFWAIGPWNDLLHINTSPANIIGLVDATNPTNIFNGEASGAVLSYNPTNLTFGFGTTGLGTKTSIVANTGKITVGGGVSNSGSGLQHKRVASCTTAAAANATCSTTVTWNTAFADANYTPTCSLTGSNLVIQGFGTPVAASISVTIQNAGGVSTANSGTLDCNAMHD